MKNGEKASKYDCATFGHAIGSLYALQNWNTRFFHQLTVLDLRRGSRDTPFCYPDTPSICSDTLIGNIDFPSPTKPSNLPRYLLIYLQHLPLTQLPKMV